MTVLLDTNILLDVALQRPPFLSESDAVICWCKANPGRGFVAWHSISNFYYIASHSRPHSLTGSETRTFIAALLDICDIAETGTSDAKLALHLPTSDYEDALQIAAALAVGADYIITRDAADYA